MQQASSNDSEISEPLSYVARDIGLHLDHLRKFWERAFYVKYGIELDISKTVLWQDFKSILVNKQALRFIESKIELFDFLALYVPEYFVKEQNQEL